jgi:RHS repeat-associated protein
MIMKHSFLIVLISIFSVKSFAGIEPVTRGKIATPISTGTAQPVVVGTATASTTVTINTPQLSTYTDVLKQGVVTFGVDHHYDSLFSTQAIKVYLLITKYASINSTVSATESVALTIWNAHVDSASFEDKASYFFDNVEKYSVAITGIEVDNQAVNRLPSNLYVYADLFVNRVYDFTGQISSVPNLLGLSAQEFVDTDCDQHADELKISWDPIPGAEEYQLEWTYVNNYAATGTSVLLPTDVSINYRTNSTRINTTATHYSITLAFDQGYVCYRVRAIGRNTTDLTKRIVGVWTTASDEVLVSQTNYATITPQMAYEIKKNWQYSTTYAEEGKSKEVISFFDGSLRNRQMVTRINSDDNVIVGQTIYDHQGRGTVQVLPTPVEQPACSSNSASPALKYYNNWSSTATATPFDRSVFDLSTGNNNCSLTPAPMGTNSGAAQYYSSSNGLNSNENGYIPNAQGFPYSQVEYTPDNTGRIRRQGGVGPDFQLGSGHESRYYYGQPLQVQLDRLFGSEVGDFSHYQKNLVIDANGQVSVSYLDQEGRVVATALAGESPSNLAALPSNFSPVSVHDELINEFHPSIANSGENSLIHNQKILISSLTNVQLTYGLEVPAYSNSCTPDLCYDCIYDLSISFVDECGVDLLAAYAVNKKVTGRFVIVNGVPQFQTLCANGSFVYAPSAFSIQNVPVGDYQLIKILTINSKAFNYYLTQFLDENFNECLTPLETLQTNAINSTDMDDCLPIDCAACLAALGDLTSFIVAGKGTEEEYNEQVELCNASCIEKSTCEILTEKLVTDVLPDGQYAEYENANGQFAVNTFPLSVLNETNHLPKATANWRFPKLATAAGFVNEYREEGLLTRSKIPVTQTTIGGYQPAVANATLVFTDPSNGVLYTFPENLANVADFIVYYENNPSWAHSLIFYHPEYGYLLSCKDQEQPYGTEVVSSYDFDKKMAETETWNEAVQNGFIKSNYASIQNVNQRLTNWNSITSAVYDPFWAHAPHATNATTINTLFDQRFTNYQVMNGVTYSLVEIVAIMNRCASSTIGYQPSASCTRFGDNISTNSTSNTAMRDAEWVALKGLYLALKQELQQNLADQNTLTIPDYYSYNGCIGNTAFDPTIAMIDYNNYNSSPYFNGQQSCSGGNTSLYANKQKRVMRPNEANNPSGQLPTANEMAYHMYIQTGKCPTVSALENVLNDLAVAQLLDEPTYNVTNQTSFSSLELAQANFNFTGPLPIVTGTTTTSATMLDLLWQTATGTYATVTLSKQANEPIVFNWDDISLLHSMSASQLVNGLYEFTILAQVPLNNTTVTVTLSGTTSINVTSCQFEEVCEKNQLGNDLTILLKSIAAVGEFASTNYVIKGNSAPLDMFVTPAIQSAIANQAVQDVNWSFDGTSKFYVQDASNPNQLVLQINAISPTTFTTNDFNLIGGISKVEAGALNTMKLTLVDAFGNFLAQLTLSLNQDIMNVKQPVYIGTCDLPTPLLCRTPSHENARDLEAVLGAVLPYSGQTTYDLRNAYQLSSALASQLAPLNASLIGVTSANNGIAYIDFATDNCGFQLAIDGTTYAGCDFANLVHVGQLEVIGAMDNYSQFHDFKLAATFDVNGTIVSGYIVGTSCVPLKKCQTCPTTPSVFEETAQQVQQRLQAIIDAGMTFEVLTAQNYEQYLLAIDSLNNRNNWDTTNNSFVQPVDYKYFSSNGINYPITTYLRFLSDFDTRFDSLKYAQEPLKFIQEYGTATNVEAEYGRYNRALDYYNNLRATIGLATATPIDLASFAMTKYTDHLQEYVAYLDANKYYPTVLTPINGYPTLTAASIEDGTCAQLYNDYVTAFTWYSNNSSQFTNCGEFQKLVNMTSYETFLLNNLCCSANGVAAFEAYIATFYDTTICPVMPPVFPSCQLGDSLDSETCQQYWANYVDQIDKFNTSIFAQVHSVNLTLLYPDYSLFMQTGKCNCIIDYLNYLDGFIQMDQSTALLTSPQVLSIDAYCPSQALPEATDPCVLAYNDYLNCVNHYNEWALVSNNDYLGRLINLEDFIANNLCFCVDKYCASLQQVIDGFTSLALVPDLLSICSETTQAPCEPSVSGLTAVEETYQAYLNPCVELYTNAAYVNAQLAYEAQIALLTEQFTQGYIAHCMRVDEKLAIDYNEAEYHFTLYYYDQAGNLIKTVPPEGVQALNMTTATRTAIEHDRKFNTHQVITNHTLATTYQYNSLNQLVAQWMPDQDAMEIMDVFTPTGVPMNFQTTAIQLIDGAVGYMTGFVPSPSLGMGSRGYLLKTVNGGTNWQRVEGTLGASLSGITWLTSTLGYAFGTDGTLLETKDGGFSWDLLNTYQLGITTKIVAAQPTSVVNGTAKMVFCTAKGEVLLLNNGTLTIIATVGVSVASIDDMTLIEETSSQIKLKLAGTQTNTTWGNVAALISGKLTYNGSAWSESWTVDEVKLPNATQAAMYSATEGYVFRADGQFVQLKTVNGVAQQIIKVSNLALPMKTVYFLNENRGITVLEENQNTRIGVTMDGGLTWSFPSVLTNNHFELALIQKTTSQLNLVASNGFITYQLVLKSTGQLGVVPQTSLNPLASYQWDQLTALTVANQQVYYGIDNGQLFRSNRHVLFENAVNFTATAQTVPTASIRQFKGIVYNGLVYLFALGTNGVLYTTKETAANQNFQAWSSMATSVSDFTLLSNTAGSFVVATPTTGGAFLQGQVGVTSLTALSGTTTAGYEYVICSDKYVTNFGTLGRVRVSGQLNGVPTSLSWNDRLLQQIANVTLNAVTSSATDFALVGDKGVYAQATVGNNEWALLPTTSKSNLYDVRIFTNNQVMIVGAQGQAQQKNTASTTASWQNIVALNGGSVTALSGNNAWRSIGVQGNSVYLVGENSLIAYTTDILSNLFAVQFGQSTSDYTAVSWIPQEQIAVAVTQQGGIFRLSGMARTAVKMIFGPIYRDVHFADEQTGTLVGAHFALKTTNNGGQSWETHLPNSLSVLQNNVHALRKVATMKVANHPTTIVFGGVNLIGNLLGNSLTIDGTPSGVVTALKFNNSTTNSGYYALNNQLKRVVLNTNNTVNWTQSVTSFSDTIHALHVFDNNGLLATGLNYIKYVNPTGGVVLPSQPNSSALATVSGNMRAVYCHDHTDGYAAGDNYKWYTIEAVPDPVTKIWTGFTIAAYTPSDATLGTPLPHVKALAYASRSRGVWGGTNNGASYVRYANDLRNRISARFFYDRLGRIVVSQNSRQQAQNRFSYSLYDALGRVVEAGEKTENTPGANVLAFAQIFGAYVGGNLVPSVIDDTKLATWLNTQANTTRKEVTRSYYDRTNTSILAQLPSNFTPDPLTQRKRIVHVTYEAVFDSNDATYDHATHYDYDIHGNVKTLLQDNANLGALNQLASQRFKRMDYTFDLISGNVHRVDYETNKADQWHHAYSYDADNRITAVYTTSATPLVNDPLAMSSLQNEPLLNPTWEKEAAYSYYAHGPLARTVIGEQEVQGLDYVYTLQGWIKGVNSNNLDANNDPGKDGLGLSANHRVAQDVMGYSLHYFNNDYLPIVNGNTTFIADQSNSDMLQNSSDLYNGNIARMVTTITDPDSRAVLPLGNAYRYDQLNRLKHAVSFDQLNGNAWAGGAPAKYENSFTYDANGNILTQTRNDDNNQVIDELAYFYPQNAANKTVRNRLLYVSDNVDYDASDIDPGMSTSNYAYDQEGRLIQDLQEEIASIEWRVDGKVKRINRIANSAKQNLSFDYDAMGHRIAKHVYTSANVLEKSTYYVLDATGNTMATYERTVDENTLQISYAQTEKFIYGSSRLGVQNVNIGLLGSQNNTYTQTTVVHRIGKKGYELSNHLGNVLSVISDKVIPHSNGTIVDYWLADILQSSDYSPFGVKLKGRNLNKTGNTELYRSGFQGQEEDDELKGDGNSVNFEFRMHDPRLGRFFAIDPLSMKFPYYSPYHFCSNSPIMAVEIEGLETSIQINYVEGSITITRDANNRLSVTSEQLAPITGNYHMAYEGRAEFKLVPGGYVDIPCTDCGNPGTGMEVFFRIFIPTEIVERKDIVIIPGQDEISKEVEEDTYATITSDISKTSITGFQSNFPNTMQPDNRKAALKAIQNDIYQGIKDKYKPKGKFNLTEVTIRYGDKIDINALVADVKKTFGKNVKINTEMLLPGTEVEIWAREYTEKRKTGTKKTKVIIQEAIPEQRIETVTKVSPLIVTQ